jgi:hypothetical protein
MRSSRTVYRADGTPIEVVTVQNDHVASAPLASHEIQPVEAQKLVENKSLTLNPSISQSEPDR